MTSTHFQRHCMVNQPIALTDTQKEDLRKINLAEIKGLRHIARALLDIYRRENPSDVRTFNGSSK